MIPQVQTALNSILGNVATLRMAGGAGRAFELLVIGGVARALQVRGYDVWLQRSDGTRILPGDTDRRFIQRGGAPTGIRSAAEGRDNSGVIGFRFQQRPACELWNERADRSSGYEPCPNLPFACRAYAPRPGVSLRP